MRRLMVRFVAVVLAVASSATAYAYQPGVTRIPPGWGGQRAPAYGRVTRFPDTVTCSPSQSAAIEQAFGEARRRIQRAVAFLDANPRHPHLRQWFGNEVSPGYLRSRYLQILAAMQPGRRPTILCGTPACGSFGRSWRQLNTMAVCTLFWRARASGQDARYGVIVHEMSHIAFASVDFVYGPPAAAALAARDSERAMQNADNFEYFVEFLPVR
jgi:hypothetical protein